VSPNTLVLALVLASTTLGPPLCRADPLPNGIDAGGPPAAPITAEVAAATTSYRERGQALPVLRRPSGLVYPFGHGPAALRCAPLRVCVVELEAGETLLNTVLGDSDRWLVEGAATGPRGETPLLVVKPTACDLTTNLVVSTDRRVYELVLSSPACRADELASLNPELPYTTLVRFYYPDDLVRTWTEREQLEQARLLADARSLTPLAADPTELSFRYTVSGRRFPWRPEQVFDDGRHTYIKLPREAARHPAPVLFLLQDDGSTAVLNYAERAGFLVADRVVDRALLVLGDRKERRELRITNLARQEARP